TASGIASGERDIVIEQADNSGAGWLADWGHRIRIDIDHTKVDSDLTYFPVLVPLSVSSGIGNEDVTAVFDEIGANYLKMAVTESDGTTEMFMDIEYWDEVGEEAWLWTSNAAWVISNAADTTIYLYFDNTHADNGAQIGLSGSVAAQSVWDANFVLVDHMQDDGDNATTYDSTSNNNDGTKAGAANPTQSTGQIGYAQDFDGATSDIDSGADASFDMGRNGMIEMIINPDAVQTDDPATLWRHGNDLHFELTGSLTMQAEAFWGGGWRTSAESAALPSGTWTYVVGSWLQKDAADSYWQNWISDAQSSLSTMIGFPAGINTNGEIGGDAAHTRVLTGLIDEIRVSNILRGADWREVTNDSLFDNLIDFIPYDADYMEALEYDLRVLVDGNIEDRQLGLSVPDNANDWILMGDATPYWGQYEHTVSSVLIADYEPTTMIRGETYDTGTVTVTNGDATVVGAGGAAWTDVMEGGLFLSTDAVYYLIDSVTDATHLELSVVYGGGTLGGQTYDMYVRLPDLEGAVQDGLITWGTNPAGVGATIGSMVSSGQSSSIGTTGDTSTDDILPVTGGTDWRPEAGVSAALLANP
ncbi:MAG: hypothetical protein KAJ19_08685, partial [Gammaproteobacteria bacterium]|nr:hypothetical protein [Gammaproteobacteria bacterium]